MFHDSIDPSSLAALTPLQPLEVRVKALKNSVRLQGSHFLALRKPNRSPESSRSFVQGDPVNLIDWKAYARNDQLIVREKRDEASSKIQLCLDVGDTMRWPVEPYPKPEMVGIPPKFQVATRIAFNLAHIHLRMGDTVEIWLLTSGTDEVASYKYRPRSPSDIVVFFNYLQSSQFEEEKYLSSFTPDIFRKAKFDISYWIGDCLGNGNYRSFLDNGKLRMLIHTLSSLEVDVAWMDQDTCYFDDAFGRKEYLGGFLNQAGNYSAGLSDWTGRLHKKLKEEGGGYLLATDKTAISTYLNFLSLTTRR